MNLKEHPRANTCTMEPAANRIEAALSMLEACPSVAGLATGFSDLDAITGGLMPSQLIVIGSRPSMGKSTLARNIAEFVSVDKQLPVAIFSMTESTQMILSRMIKSRAQIDSALLRSGRLSPNQWRHVKSTAESIKQAPLYVDESATHTPVQIRSKALQLQAQHNDLALLIVDDLTKVSYSGDSSDPFERLVSVCEELKTLAHELNIPIIATSPVTSKTDLRQNNWPTLADLPQSPAIELTADTVILIYRDEYYNPDSKQRGEAEIIFAKNKTGPTGLVNLLFQGTTGRFLNKVIQWPPQKKATNKSKSRIRKN